jgi:hypothetical protein
LKNCRRASRRMDACDVAPRPPTARSARRPTVPQERRPCVCIWALELARPSPYLKRCRSWQGTGAHRPRGSALTSENVIPLGGKGGINFQGARRREESSNDLRAPPVRPPPPPAWDDGSYERVATALKTMTSLKMVPWTCWHSYLKLGAVSRTPTCASSSRHAACPGD